MTNEQQPIPTEDYLPVLFALARLKRHRTTAPTKAPRTFLEQFELYDDGVARRLYVYVNKTWRYVTLT